MGSSAQNRAREQKLAQHLVQRAVLDQTQTRSCFAWIEQWDGRLTRAIFELRLALEKRVVDVVSNISGAAIVDFSVTKVEPRALERLDTATCQRSGVIPFAIEGATLCVAMAEPFDKELIAELEAKIRMTIRPFTAGEGAIQSEFEKTLSSQGQYAYGVPTPSAGQSILEEFKLVDGRGNTINVAPGTPLVAPASSPQPAPQHSTNPVDPLAQQVASLTYQLEETMRVVRILGELMIKRGLARPEDFQKQPTGR